MAMDSDATGTSKHTNQFSISAKQLSKRFNREWIFRNFTFQFKAGSTYAVVGPNGSGKSTLLQVLWGQVPPTSGTLTYHSGGSETDADQLYTHLAIAAPYMELIDEFTLQESIDFHFKLRKLRPGVRPADLPEIMYLADHRHKPLGKFSSGMKQRVKLALAFYTQADVLFLDEPCTNLDARAFDWYLDQLDKVTNDNTIRVIASNNPAEYPGNVQKIDLLTFK